MFNVAFAIYFGGGIMDQEDYSRVSEEDQLIRIETIEELEIKIIHFPRFNGGEATFSQIFRYFAALPNPGGWHMIFNRKHYVGHATFDELRAASAAWYKLVGETDKGRLAVTVDDNPLTVNRFETNSYFNLFPTRNHVMLDTLEEGLQWMRDQIEGRPGPE